MRDIKDMFMDAHEQLIEEYLERHPHASEAEAYKATADKAYNRIGPTTTGRKRKTSAYENRQHPDFLRRAASDDPTRKPEASMADLPESGCGDRNQALKRMRRHMQEDKISKLERGRYGWTHYPKGSKADDEMLMLRLRSDGKA